MILIMIKMIRILVTNIVIITKNDKGDNNNSNKHSNDDKSARCL